MAFNIGQIANSFLNVRNKIKDANGNWVDQTKPRETQEVKHGLRVNFSQGDVPVFEVWDKKVIIDSFEWSPRSRTRIAPFLSIEQGVMDTVKSQYFSAISPGQSYYRATSQRISEDKHDHFETVSDNVDGMLYKVILKRPIILSQGGKLIFRAIQTPEPSDDITYRCIYRVIE